MKNPKFKKILSILLYSLPVLFFILCYFAIITSGEDIFQGAHTSPNILSDALAAFNHSARLADMFAWAVINFFDYSFSFGPDLFFRLLDVVAAFSAFYLATSVALRRRPRLDLKDALTFNALFLLVMLTSNGPTIYSGFSKIHNYLFISFFTFVFFLVELRALLGKPLPKGKLFALGMFILGFLFGLASNVAAIVFLPSLVAYALYLKLRRRPLNLKSFFLSFQGSSLLGILLALFLIYVVGPGLADYETSEAYLIVCDYLPLSSLLENPLPSLLRVVKHNLYNFGKFFLPFLVSALPEGFYFLSLKLKNRLVLPKFPPKEIDFLVASALFVVLHLLCLSQIYYPTRLMFPIYLLAAALFLFVSWRFLSAQKRFQEKTFLAPLSALFVALSVLIFALRAYFAYGYLKKVLPVLETIKSSPESSLCVEESVAHADFLPYLHLNQEDFLVDWALPQTIYDKSVTFCEQ